MALLFHFSLLFFGFLTAATLDSIQLIYSHNDELHQTVFSGHAWRLQPNAVTVTDDNLGEVSRSVLTAEAWVKTHVLARYPATKITTIVVGEDQGFELGVVLESVKNIYYSLTRWGLEREIKVSFTVKKSQLEAIKKLGFLNLNKINALAVNQKPMKRKLFSINPYPARPTPLLEISPFQLHSSIGFSVPANVARQPSIPVAAPPLSVPFVAAPPPIPFAIPPVTGFASPPYDFSLPPCSPPATSTMPPVPGTVQHKLWCVAKPSVPAETLQEAIDYACGAGGADCDEIMPPHGSCFYPDTVVAHASYALNNYWQKTKRSGGTCSFGGTAMLINTDPSFLRCRFVLG